MCLLDDGDLPIDSNWSENQIRPIAIGRGNWLFAASLRAGSRAAAIMSLVHSARLNGHDPYAYLRERDVLERLKKCSLCDGAHGTRHRSRFGNAQTAVPDRRDTCRHHRIARLAIDRGAVEFNGDAFRRVDVVWHSERTRPMLRSMKDLENYAIGATDGQIGHVKDFYFDDDAWVVRYLVVETGSWLSSRKVLITPISINHANWAERTLSVSIAKEQVKNSPDIDTDKPVSRQNEMQYLGYYGYPYYWGGVGMWGEGLHPYALEPGFAGYRLDRPEREQQALLDAERARHRNDDPHLRSCKAVVGYHIHAKDGEIGHVDGFLVDEETWAIRYLVVNTSNWWVGHKVLVAPTWITGVHWSDETVSVDLTRESVKLAPPYDSAAELNREREMGLYGHYGRRGYWAGSAGLEREI